MSKQLTILNERWKVWCAVYAGTDDMEAACRTSGLRRSTVNLYKNDPLILAQIKEYMEDTIERTLVDKGMVLQHLSDMKHSDIGDIYDDWGRFKPLSQWPLIWRQQIEGLEYENGYITKVRFIKRMDIINGIGKHTDVGAYEDKLKVTHGITDDLAELIRQGRNRLAGNTLEYVDGEVIES